MGRGTQSLARVAVVVRAGAAPLWWLGVVAAGTGLLLPGLTGRRIGVLAGAALFLVTAAVVALVRRRRYTHFADCATRAGRHDVLQDRRVTLRVVRRSRRWWLLLAFLAAVASSLVLPAAGGAVLAGAGAGLWLKAVWLGRREQAAETLLWLRTDRLAEGPVGKRAKGFRTTGIAAGDAAPGGARRRR
ncbi:hypothetical protein ACH46N_34375 [Streptomyces pristinaespiralis]|uniref:Membrane protein n=1 Tax=Streptomyces pristinaespiralis TaxID=38300 RepID=A0A0M4DCA1_STRPR|nr:hypothetical protein [Streptomyces pristinaespiralis]ALC22777.1 membrane protein [Streptomyces pristinaespiralis]QMU14667.1 hypothetical protein H3L99_14515 [Streptomyces pristinaespiralis]